MRRAMTMAVSVLLVAGCGSGTDAGGETAASSPIETQSETTDAVADSTAVQEAPLASPDTIGALLSAAGLPCPLEPVAKDDSPLALDIPADEYRCVLGYEQLTVGFYDSADARAAGLDELIATFGPMMKGFGLSEVSYGYAEDGNWTVTLEPAAEGFTPDIQVPATEPELLALVARTLGGEVHTIRL